ncbi:MAG TPA: S41 family peptidase [Thermoanaerobaculia bacterium]|nr:S41 family peptidase [Thermoanaerobaculia bacterium]
MRRLAPLLLGFLLLSPALPAAVPAAAKLAAAGVEVERLSHLGRLWGVVRYLHPWLAYKEIDWDAALVQAIPRVRAAQTPAQYAAAAQTMLDALGDAVTRVQPVRTGDPADGLPPGDSHPSLVQWLEPGVLALYCRPDAASSYEEMVAKLAAARPEIPKAKTLIADIRGIHGWPFQPQYLLSEVEGVLVARPATAPAQRHLVHSGYRSQLHGRQGDVSSGFLTQYPEIFPAAVGPAPQRVVFLMSPETEIPPLVAALQATGQGAVVAEGKIGEEGLVHQRTVALGEGFEALVRTTEVVPAPGWPGVHADLEVAPGKAGASGEADAAFAAALKLSRDGWPPPSPSIPAPLPQPSGRLDKPYKEMTDPSLEYRLLAVFRLWNVFHYFHPYIELAGDWNAVLPEFIARMMEVHDGDGGRGYALTIAEMAARTGDGHTSVTGNPTLDALYGEAPLPFLIRWIEGAWVVTAVSADPAIRSHGEPEPGETGEDEEEAGKGAKTFDYVEVGDVVVSLDGVPVAVREDLLRRHYAASTEAGMRRKLADHLLSGPQGSAVAVTVRGRDGRLKTVKLRRGPWTPKPAGETVRLLPDNLGYVDLNRLTFQEIDGMFERLKGTRGIVFDMRGYPNGTGWRLAARLNVRHAPFGALFRRPLVTGLGDDEEREEQTGVSFSQPFPAPGGPLYTGRTVLLIDERTVSQAEHLGLFFEVANGTKLVGTPTAGANGDVTYFNLPGIASVRFSGHEVRHADGRQLQRIGLVPDILAAPTLKGVREGKDEVLERGIEVLKRELAQGEAGSPAAPRRASGRGEGISAY